MCWEKNNLEFILSETLSRIKANKEFSNKNRELFFFSLKETFKYILQVGENDPRYKVYSSKEEDQELYRVERPLLVMGKVCLPLMGLAFTSFGICGFLLSCQPSEALY